MQTNSKPSIITRKDKSDITFIIPDIIDIVGREELKEEKPKALKVYVYSDNLMVLDFTAGKHKFNCLINLKNQTLQTHEV